MNRKAPRIHYFETPAGDRMVTISLDLLAEITDLEDLEDEVMGARLAWERAQAGGADNAFAYPFTVVQRLEAGENPIKVWREHRRLTQHALAEAVNSTATYISQLETGRRQPSRKMLAAIAEVLGVPVNILLEDLKESRGANTAA